MSVWTRRDKKKEARGRKRGDADEAAVSASVRTRRDKKKEADKRKRKNADRIIKA